MLTNVYHDRVSEIEVRSWRRGVYLHYSLRNTGGRAKLKLYVSFHNGERVLIEVVVEVECIFRNFNQSHLQNQYKTVTKRKKNRTHGERRQK